MKTIKTYEDFVNEEINWRKAATGAALGAGLAFSNPVVSQSIKTPTTTLQKQVDEFTGEIKYEIKDQGGDYSIIKIISKGVSKYYLSIYLKENTIVNGKGVYLILSDGKRISKPNADVETTSIGVSFYARTLIQLNSTDIEMLKNAGISKYKLYIFTGATEYAEQTKDLFNELVNTKSNSVYVQPKKDSIKSDTILKTPSEKSESDEIFNIVDKMPEFPGGVDKMMEYIQNNIQYPKAAKDAGIGGTCFLKFTVNKDGIISDVQVLKGVPGCFDCDKEAIRIVKSMPNWVPGELNGKSVNVYFNLPIKFK